MKKYLFLIFIVALGGCASSGDSSTPVDPGAKSSATEQIQKIQSDSSVPDGLKKIQTDTLRKQPGG